MDNALIPLQQSSSLTVPIGNLDAYIAWVHQVPLLSQEEESQLTKDLYENNDLQAAKKLILAHLRYVVKVSRGYLGYGLPLGDLIQEGNVGLMKAVKRFDPSYGVRLVTFAMYWIKSEIHDYVIKNWRVVKIATTKAQRKLFFNLRSYKKKFGTYFTKEEISQVAEDLKVTESEVLMMEERMLAIDSAFDAPLEADDDKAYLAPTNYLEDNSSNPELVVIENDTSNKENNTLNQALLALDERSRDILNARWLSEPKATLHDLADKYKVSAERIRQLEKNAMNKIKKQLKETV